MCNRFHLLFHIHIKTINEIILFLYKSKRIYYLLILGSLYNIIIYYIKNNTFFFIYSIILTLLYSIFLYLMSKLTYNYQEKVIKKVNKNDLNLILYCIINIFFISITYLMQFIYLVITMFNYSLFFNLISIIIQYTTIYILIQLRKKVNESDQQLIENNESNDNNRVDNNKYDNISESDRV